MMAKPVAGARAQPYHQLPEQWHSIKVRAIDLGRTQESTLEE